jgi:hypothetical protein
MGLSVPELTIAQHTLRTALGAIPLELADGCLRVDLGKLLGSTDGQLAAIDLASRWMAEGVRLGSYR